MSVDAPESILRPILVLFLLGSGVGVGGGLLFASAMLGLIMAAVFLLAGAIVVIRLPPKVEISTTSIAVASSVQHAPSDVWAGAAARVSEA